MFKADSEKIFRPFISARAADIFDIRTAIRSSNEVLDSSLYRVHDDDKNISLYVLNDNILTLLDIYTKHHLNHGEEICVKKLKTVENSLFMDFYAERFP